MLLYNVHSTYVTATLFKEGLNVRVKEEILQQLHQIPLAEDQVWCISFTS